MYDDEHSESAITRCEVSQITLFVKVVILLLVSSHFCHFFAKYHFCSRPPILLFAVAFSWCPSARLKYSALVCPHYMDHESSNICRNWWFWALFGLDFCPFLVFPPRFVA